MPLDSLDPIVQRLNELERRIAFLEANAESSTGANADTVDGFHASGTPMAGTLLALDASSTWPDDVVDFGTLTTDAQVYATTWENDTMWTLSNSSGWQTDTQSTTVTVRRKSTVVVALSFRWTDATASRIDIVQFRLSLGGSADIDTDLLGCTVNTRMFPTVWGHWTGVTSNSTLVLQAAKNGSYLSDTVWVTDRKAIIWVIPED